MNPHDVGLAVMAFAAGICFAQGYNAVRGKRRSKRIAKAVRQYAMAERVRAAYRAHDGCEYDCGASICPRAGVKKPVDVKVTLTTARPVRTTPCHFLGCTHEGHHKAAR